MQEAQIEQYIVQSKSDDLLRHRIIQHYKPYIINTIGYICKRFITWSDEESSIGLLAFNRAIDTYDPHGGRVFQSYAFLLINRDLINYFRQSKKTSHLSLNYSSDEEMAATMMEPQTSMEFYHEERQTNDLVEEILELDGELKHFGIAFEELEEVSPKHRDTRTTLHQMVFQFMQYNDLKDELIKKKRFPISAFNQRTGHPQKMIERYRKYLVTLIIIKLHREWVHLSEYIQMESGKEAI